MMRLGEPAATTSHRMVAVIAGAGLMGRFHAAAARHAGAKVVAIVDPDIAAARRLAGRLPGCVAGGALAPVLAQLTPDVVHLCTPEGTHHDLGLTIAEAGCHALVEKPLSGTAAQAQELVDRFSRAGRFVVPVHQYAFQPCFGDALVRLDTIRPLRRLAFDIRSAGAIDAPDRIDEIAGAILPHPLSMVQRVFPAADIARSAWTLAAGAPGEWMLHTSIDEVLIAISISMSGRPTMFRSELVGDGGSIQIDGFHGFATMSRARSSRRHKLLFPLVTGAQLLQGATINLAARLIRREFGYVGLRSLTGAFYACIRSGDPARLPVSPAQAIANVETCEAIIGLARPTEARGRHGA